MSTLLCVLKRCSLVLLTLFCMSLPTFAQQCLTSNSAFNNNAPFPAQTGTFPATFDVTPSSSNIDAVTGLSLNAPTGYTSLAVIVRFNSSGFVDVRNGGTYAAAASVPYTAGQKYHLRLSVNIVAHTYSVYVTPPGGSEITLASNYAFRSEQSTVASLNTWGVESDSGSETACNTTASAVSTLPLNVSGVAKFTPSGAAIVSGAALNFFQWSGTAWTPIGTISSDSSGNLSGTITVQPALAGSSGTLSFQIQVSGIGASVSFSLLTSQFSHHSTGLTLSLLVFDSSIDAKTFSVGLLP